MCSRTWPHSQTRATWRMRVFAPVSKLKIFQSFIWVQSNLSRMVLLFCSVARSCPTLCNPWTAARQASQSFPISQSWLKLMSIESVMPWNHLILCCPLLLCLQSFPTSGSFPVSQLFISGDQNIGASASAWVLLMNIQDWFPLRLTGLLLMSSQSLDPATVQYSQDVSNHSFLEIDSNALGGSKTKTYFQMILDHKECRTRPLASDTSK